MSGLLLEIVRQFPLFGYPPVITIYARLRGDNEGLERAQERIFGPPMTWLGVTQRDSVLSAYLRIARKLVVF